jgi:uncharacterized tellurite resistance protein B-like protein
VKLADLHPFEKHALLALIRMLVRMDGVVTPGETRALAALAKDLGSAEFWETMREVQQLIGTPEDVVTVVERVERPAVKAWIYGILVRVAAADGRESDDEAQLLGWVEETFGLSVSA